MIVDVISKLITVNQGKDVVQILLDNNNKILLPYSTIEYYLGYQPKTFQKKLKSGYIVEFCLAYDIKTLNVRIVNIKGLGTNLKKAFYLDNVVELIRYELQRVNKRKADSKKMNYAVTAYNKKIITELK
jgi:hypothetical protein